MTKARTAAALTLLILLTLIGIIATTRAFAEDGEGTLPARIAALRANDGTIAFCVELGETRERICPQRRRVRFADAPDGTWLASEWLFIAAETSLRIRVQRVDERLEFALQLNADGVREHLLPRRRFLAWDRAPVGQWQRSSVVTLRLAALPHWELNGQGVAPWASRLTLDQPAPEFRLRSLEPGGALAMLSELRRPGAPTAIVFWASWAPYGLNTLNSLERLASQRTFTLIAINVYEEQADAIAALREQGAGVAIHLRDADAAVARHYRVDGLPEIFLLDGAGFYRAVIRGAAPLHEILAALSRVE